MFPWGLRWHFSRRRSDSLKGTDRISYKGTDRDHRLRHDNTLDRSLTGEYFIAALKAYI